MEIPRTFDPRTRHQEPLPTRAGDVSRGHARFASAGTAMREGNCQIGFTLIELVIVVAVVAVLAAIALPAYDQVVIRSNRSAAQRFMMDVANREEQYLNNQRSYTNALDATGLSFPAPPELATRYTFSIVVDNACCGPTPNWRITADSIGPQAGDPDLTLDSLGNKSPADKW